MRGIATALASASAFALLVSAASAGGGFGDGGCQYGHISKTASIQKEQSSMSTFDGTLPEITIAEETANTDTVCEDGDPACERKADQ